MNLTREELEEMLKVAKYASKGFKLNQDILYHHNTYITLLESVLGLSGVLKTTQGYLRRDGINPGGPGHLGDLSSMLQEALEKYGVK